LGLAVPRLIIFEEELQLPSDTELREEGKGECKRGTLSIPFQLLLRGNPYFYSQEEKRELFPFPS
jgi:hypothetical protein